MEGEVDPDQYILFSREQKEREKKGTVEYKEGPLGKERNTDRILRKER